MMMTALAQGARIIHFITALAAASIFVRVLKILSHNNLARIEDVNAHPAFHIANLLGSGFVACQGSALQFSESAVHGYPPLLSKDSISAEAVKTVSDSFGKPRLIMLVQQKLDGLQFISKQYHLLGRG